MDRRRLAGGLVHVFMACVILSAAGEGAGGPRYIPHHTHPNPLTPNTLHQNLSHTPTTGRILPAHMHPAPPPLPTSLLWERLRALFGRVIAAIGAPALLATLTIAPLTRTAIARQITLIEILARKLLLAEAAALLPAPQRGPRVVEITLAASGLYTLPQTRRRRAPARARAIDPAQPETWSARFALAVPSDGRTVDDRRAPRIRALWRAAPPPAPTPEPMPRHRNSDAFRIARRAEALRRLFDDPAPHVQRLAHSRRVGVARSCDAIKRYALRAPRRFVGDNHDPKLTLDIFSAALHAHAILTDTS